MNVMEDRLFCHIVIRIKIIFIHVAAFENLDLLNREPNKKS